MFNEETNQNVNSSNDFNKAEWVRQKKEERDFAFKTIDNMLGMIRNNAEGLKDYLDIQSRFYRYSVSNILLINAQNPKATKVGDFKYWKNAGYYVNKGVKGIIVMEPGKEFRKRDGSKGVNYNTKRVFDIAQTNAPREPEPNIHRDGRLLLKALINNAPCEVKVDEGKNGNAVSGYNSTDRTIYVSKGYSTDTLFPSIANELAHAHMDAGNYDRSKCKDIAYCVAYVLCKRNGIDVSKFDFSKMTDRTSKLTNKEMKTMLSEIKDISNQISRDMNELFEKSRESVEREEGR